MDNTSHASMPQEGYEDNRKRHHEGGGFGYISSTRSRSSTHDEAHDGWLKLSDSLS